MGAGRIYWGQIATVILALAPERYRRHPVDGRAARLSKRPRGARFHPVSSAGLCALASVRVVASV